eukprot:TRINITY_DN10983_c0_g1_i1.p1 TRINITY_DN10983_c0_g1~~TRINITY_DN10983_c0_g1_i1.p1  ORF type:complete len:1583 (+),score=317.50 TRINITY_DN10983_c0_g1_i1:600-4751(+)
MYESVWKFSSLKLKSSHAFTCSFGFLLRNLFMYAYMMCLSGPLQGLVKEKKTKLRELLKIMGMNNSTYWVSWILRFFIPNIWTTIIVTVFGGLIIFRYVSLFLLFLQFALFGFSLITFGFLLSSLVNNEKIANALGVIWIYLIGNISILTQNAPLGIKYLLSLLSPCAFNFSLSILLEFQYDERQISLSKLFSDDPYATEISNMLTYMGFTLLDTLIYLFFAWYFSEIYPGEHGVARPFYFMFTRDYWCPQATAVFEEELLLNEVEEAQLDDPPYIRIDKITKKFEKSKDDNPAVNQFSDSIQQDKIYVLLGHNGAGKSTLISMLIGMTPVTSGNAYIDGKSVVSNISDIRNQISYCPQESILLPELTPREHLTIFGTLRDIPLDQLPAEIEKIVQEVDLTEKLDNEVSKLSGGMKRKLSTAIALLGDSKVVFLDEPSSGLDPLSRRQLWDLLKKKKKGRVIILTTHFMEEADYLGDQITIMDHGSLKCKGSPQFLKEKYGTGYYLHLTIRSPDNISEINKFITSKVTDFEVTMKVETDNEITFLLPMDSIKDLPDLVADLETSIEDNSLGIVQYGLSMTTLEDVFLSLVEQTSDTSEDKRAEISPTFELEDFQGLQKSTAFQQFRVLFKLRLINFLRDWRVSLSLLALLAIMLIIARSSNNTRLTTQIPDIQNASKLELTFHQLIPGSILYFNSTEYNLDTLFSQVQSPNLNFVTVPTSEWLNLLYSKYTLFKAGLEISNYSPYESSFLNYTVWYNEDIVLPIIVNMIHNLFLSRYDSQPLPGTPLTHHSNIRLFSHPFPTNSSSQNPSPSLSTSSNINDVIMLMMVFVIIAVSHTKSLITERENKIKFLLLSHGISLKNYYLTKIIIDVFHLLLGALCGSIVLWFFSAEIVRNSSSLVLFLLLQILYIMNVLLLNYIFSFFFDDAVQSTRWLQLINIILMTIGNVLMFLSKDRTVLHQFSIYILPFTMFVEGFQRILKITSEGVVDMSLSEGLWIIYVGLVVYAVMLFLVLVYIEKSSSQLTPGQGAAVTLIPKEDVDVDVKMEKKRLRSIAKNNQPKDPIELYNVYKNYERKQIVKGVYLGVKKGQCFGLLGPNGAGKTTTINITTSQEAPSWGKVFLNRTSIFEQKDKLYQNANFGICFQENSLFDHLSPKEHLTLLFNVNYNFHERTEDYIDSILQKIGLTEDANVSAKLLSGGNRRKLCVALTLLVGNEIIFLDEPSSGMDPRARRDLWKIISYENTNRDTSIVLTTHSMEEAERACHRIAIMVGGQFKCLGSTQHLKQRYGNVYRLIILLKSEECKQNVLEFIKSNFVKWEILDSHGLNITFSLSIQGALAQTFRLITDNKDSVGIESYSLAQTSLDQVFMYFVKDHDKDNEDNSQ